MPCIFIKLFYFILIVAVASSVAVAVASSVAVAVASSVAVAVASSVAVIVTKIYPLYLGGAGSY